MHQVVAAARIGAFGYWGVFALIAVENIFPPIPSEVILQHFRRLSARRQRLCVRRGQWLPPPWAAWPARWCWVAWGRLLQPLGGWTPCWQGRWDVALHTEKQGCGKGPRHAFARKGAASVFSSLPVRAHCAQPDLDSGGHGGHASCAVFSADGGGQHGVEHPSGGPAARPRGGAGRAWLRPLHLPLPRRRRRSWALRPTAPAGGGVCAAPCS